MKHSSTLLIMALALSGPSLAPAQKPGAPSSTIRWGSAILRQKPEWYASSEALAVADSVLKYQSSDGGWPKNTNLATPPPSLRDAPQSGHRLDSTIDNEATTLPIRFLALVAHATGEPRYRQSVERGIDYLLAAQYPNGGWPQFYPLRKGYYSHVTFNDNAMIRTLTVLRDVAAGKPPFDFVAERRRALAAAAVERGIACILRTQIKQDGRLTAWCAQYDEKTLEPTWARAYEPPSLSGSESVGIVRFLMEIDQPTPEVIAAVEGATAWFQEVAIRGKRLEKFTNTDGNRDRRLVADPDAKPLWARFYELGTNRPIFLGRDSTVRYAFGEIEHERRNGYTYFGTWPASLLSREYPRWRKDHKLSQN